MAAPKKGQKRKKAAAAAPSSATARVGLRSGGNAQRHASTGESDEAYLEEQHYAALQHHQQLQYGNAAVQHGQSLAHAHYPVASTSAGSSSLQSHAHALAHAQYDQTQHAYYQNYSQVQPADSAPAGPPDHAAGSGNDSVASRSAEQEAAAAELAQQYATVSQIEATPYTDPETGDAVYPCPFCDKSYAGKHGRSIWRRHLSNKHGIPLHIQPRRTRWDNDLNRPKDEAERHKRTLESKRRWAAKNRADKRERKKKGHAGSATPGLEAADGDEKPCIDEGNGGGSLPGSVNGKGKGKAPSREASLAPSFVGSYDPSIEDFEDSDAAFMQHAVKQAHLHAQVRSQAQAEAEAEAEAARRGLANSSKADQASSRVQKLHSQPRSQSQPQPPPQPAWQFTPAGMHLYAGAAPPSTAASTTSRGSLTPSASKTETKEMATSQQSLLSPSFLPYGRPPQARQPSAPPHTAYPQQYGYSAEDGHVPASQFPPHRQTAPAQEQPELHVVYQQQGLQRAQLSASVNGPPPPSHFAQAQAQQMSLAIPEYSRSHSSGLAGPQQQGFPMQRSVSAPGSSLSTELAPPNYLPSHPVQHPQSLRHSSDMQLQHPRPQYTPRSHLLRLPPQIHLDAQQQQQQHGQDEQFTPSQLFYASPSPEPSSLTFSEAQTSQAAAGSVQYYHIPCMPETTLHDQRQPAAFLPAQAPEPLPADVRPDMARASSAVTIVAEAQGENESRARRSSMPAAVLPSPCRATHAEAGSSVSVAQTESAVVRAAGSAAAPAFESAAETVATAGSGAAAGRQRADSLATAPLRAAARSRDDNAAANRASAVHITPVKRASKRGPMSRCDSKAEAALQLLALKTSSSSPPPMPPIAKVSKARQAKKASAASKRRLTASGPALPPSASVPVEGDVDAEGSSDHDMQQEMEGSRVETSFADSGFGMSDESLRARDSGFMTGKQALPVPDSGTQEVATMTRMDLPSSPPPLPAPIATSSKSKAAFSQRLLSLSPASSPPMQLAPSAALGSTGLSSSPFAIPAAPMPGLLPPATLSASHPLHITPTKKRLRAAVDSLENDENEGPYDLSHFLSLPAHQRAERISVESSPEGSSEPPLTRRRLLISSPVSHHSQIGRGSTGLYSSSSGGRRSPKAGGAMPERHGDIDSVPGLPPSSSCDAFSSSHLSTPHPQTQLYPSTWSMRGQGTGQVPSTHGAGKGLSHEISGNGTASHSRSNSIFKIDNTGRPSAGLGVMSSPGGFLLSSPEHAAVSRSLGLVAEPYHPTSFELQFLKGFADTGMHEYAQNVFRGVQRNRQSESGSGSGSGSGVCSSDE